MDEFGWIASHLAPLASLDGALGLKDDAAVLSVPEGMELIVTKDALVAGVHFIGDEPADSIARKALAVNLSDLAAMGATPYGYFLALMLPQAEEAWLTDFAKGLGMVQAEYGITLLGGDTTRTPGPLALSITALGYVPKGEALTRGGAKPGDGIYVSGTIGDGRLGLEVVHKALPENAFLRARYELPTPRVKLGECLRGIAGACIDISDGLMQDLGHICAVSRVGARLEYASIPLSDAVRATLATRADAPSIVLAGGDDYELLFTVPEAKRAQLAAAAKKAATQVTRIGYVVEGSSAQAFDTHGRAIPLAQTGFRHF